MWTLELDEIGVRAGKLGEGQVTWMHVPPEVVSTVGIGGGGGPYGVQ